MMDVVVRVRSSYFEADASRYRLAMSRETLLQSLKYQHDKSFSIVLDISPMDPFYTKRRAAFDSCGVPCSVAVDTVLHRRLEILVDDDDFLHPGFIVAARQKAEQKRNTRLLFPNGYVFRNGLISELSGYPDLVKVHQIVDPDDNQIHNNLMITNSPCWIHVRHTMNQSPLRFTDPPQSEILLWSGWNPEVVTKLAEMTIKTGTANGSKLAPNKSRSVVYARGNRCWRKPR